MENNQNHTINKPRVADNAQHQIRVVIGKQAVDATTMNYAKLEFQGCKTRGGDRLNFELRSNWRLYVYLEIKVISSGSFVKNSIKEISWSPSRSTE